jgi:hypothetical protein
MSESDWVEFKIKHSNEKKRVQLAVSMHPVQKANKVVHDGFLEMHSLC